MANSSDEKKGFAFAELINQGKLAWRLFRDPNVTPLVRYGIPLLGLIYLISPIDIIPDALLGLGQLDDIAVIMLLTKLFISLAPDDIVAMYRQGGQPAAPAADADAQAAGNPPPAADDEVIDTEYRVVS
jgi:uncharacterized membrane protein YkvA (DUF1232 family)